MTILQTARLRLEPWNPSHAEGLAAMSSDPRVMQYIPGGLQGLEETRAVISRIEARWARFGHSWWSFIERATGQLVGAGCVQHLRREGSEPDPACPLETGWRLLPDCWGRGLASEAARAMAAFAFDRLQAEALYAVCMPDNQASRKVMERLGMRYLGMDHWYGQELATYAISADAWRG